MMPSIFPADAGEIRHKCQFVAEVLAALGLPVIEEDMYERAEKILGAFAKERSE